MSRGFYMNKNGGEEILSIWWFFILAIVAVGIALGVFMFYSATIDVREVESEIMADRIYDCLNYNGYLRSDVLSLDFDLYKECALNEDVFSEEGAVYSFSVEIYNESDVLFESSSKSKDLRENCLIDRAIDTKDFPKCVIEEEYFLFISNGIQKKLRVSVLAVSNQKGRSLPLN